MHFTIDTKVLKNWIDIVNHASASWNMTPILENILITVWYKKIVFTANNLEMAIEYIVDEWIEIKSEWTFTISSKFLTSFVSLIQDEKINIELVANASLIFKTPSSETKIKWIEASKFPVIPILKEEQNFTILSGDLKKAIEKTIFSTAEWAVRPTLAWIYLHINEENIIFASTDSYRLSEFKMKNTSNINKNISIIIPQKTAHELSRILPENTPVNLAISENQILFIFDNIKLYSRLLNWHFPDYRSFFPKGYSTKWVVLKTDMTIALKRANLISRENNYNTRVHFDSDSWIEISTWDTEIGAWRVELPASIEWENSAIWLNSLYLIEVLNVIKDDYISIDFETSLSPIVVRWITEKEQNFEYKHIIMPLKI